KGAIINLGRYATSGDDANYQAFLKSLDVQLGDKQARLEMNKPKPDMAVVRDGFVRGRNHPNDVGDMYFFYPHLKNVSYMKSAIQTWTEGDEEIAGLRSLGEQIHEVLATSPSHDGTGLPPEGRTQLYTLFRQLYATDAKLTVLEDHFSATLGEGSRQI